MAMRIVMTFRGDVICYQKNGEWKFVFPTDDHHVVNFTNEKGATAPLRIPTSDRNISVAPGTRLGPKPNINDFFPDLLNMSGRDMHGTANGKSKLKEHKRSPTTRELIFFAVNAGKPGKSTTTMNEYWIDDLATGDPEYRLGRSVAEGVSLEIEVDDDSPFVLLIDGDREHPIAEVSYKEHRITYLHFDNHCGGGCKTEDDFLHYYDWLEEDGNPERKFLAGKWPRTSKILIEKHDDLASKAISSTVGNCDPVGSDPPPEDWP